MSALPLTFGIEMEIIYIFKECQVRSFLDRAGQAETQIVKGQRSSKSMYQSSIPCYVGRNYLAWGLLDPVRPYTKEVTLRDSNDHCVVRPYRSYLDEPLQLVQKVLEPVMDTAIWSDRYCKQTNFESGAWSLTHDNSLQSLTPDQMTQQAPALVADLDHAQDFDSYGVEIVTTPMTSTENAYKKIDAMRTALLGHDTSTPIFNQDTALHVHVGQPDGSPFPLATRQWLLLLCVIYEDEISRLHPLVCRDGTNYEIKRNRIVFAEECAPQVLRPVTETDDLGRTGTVLKQHCPVYKSIDEIKAILFDKVNQAADPEVAFQKLVGEKQQLVNFSYSSRSKEQGAATVEFRQHRGTIDPNEIIHWIEHCLALVRLTHRYATSNNPNSCAIATWDDNIDIEDLWAEMDLKEESRDFFRWKIAEYAKQAPDWTPEELFFLDESEGEVDDAYDGYPPSVHAKEDDKSSASDDKSSASDDKSSTNDSGFDEPRGSDAGRSEGAILLSM